jgi:hypothetical protein
LNRVTSAPARLATLGTATYIYHAANVFWYMLSHEQGGPITAPFSAANFTGDAAAWTVNAGNITTLAYVLRGKELSVYVAIGGSTLAGTVNFLSINNAAYGGYVSALSTDCFTMLYEGGTNSVGRMLCGPAWSTTAKMQFQKLNGQMVAGTCYVECVAVLSVS